MRPAQLPPPHRPRLGAARRGAGLVLLGLSMVQGCTDGDVQTPAPTPIVWHAAVDGYQPGAFWAVWAGGPSNVWFAGGEQAKPVVVHFDGAKWTRNDPPLTAKLRWVHGDGTGRVLVVGDAGQVALWDGKAWQALPTGHPNAVFWGAWLDADGPWVVGGPAVGAAADQDTLLILRHDGKDWQPVMLPGRATWPSSADGRLFKIWRDKTTGKRFCVGGRGHAAIGDGQNGKNWQESQAELGGGPLFTVHGRSASDVWAIGGLGEISLVHWDGSAWTAAALPTEQQAVAQGVFVHADGTVDIAAIGGYTARRRTDGAWSVSFADTTHDFHATAFDGQRTWAVGGDISVDLADHTGAIYVDDAAVPTLH